MDHQDAVERTNQILDEERLNPTVNYVVNPQESGDLLTALAPMELMAFRSGNHSQLREVTGKWVFKSANYNLLRALVAQTQEDSRDPVAKAVLSRLTDVTGCGKAKTYAYPNWNGLSSELPLVAEFCIRAGLRQDLFRILGEA